MRTLVGVYCVSCRVESDEFWFDLVWSMRCIWRSSDWVSPRDRIAPSFSSESNHAISHMGTQICRHFVNAPQRKPKSLVVRVRKYRPTFLPRIYFPSFVCLFQVEAPDADLQAGRGQVGFILARAAQGRERNVEISWVMTDNLGMNI